MRFLLLKDLIHPLKNLPSRFRGPHPTFEPFLFNFKMGEPEPPKLLLLRDHIRRFQPVLNDPPHDYGLNEEATLDARGLAERVLGDFIPTNRFAGESMSLDKDPYGDTVHNRFGSVLLPKDVKYPKKRDPR